MLKALRKESERRYLSTAQFSDDIRRYLQGLPVIARKDTVGYRTSKFVRRNRVAVAAAALVLLAMIAGLIVSLWEAQSARRQRDIAQREKGRAQQVNDFLQSILSAASPEEKGKDATVAEVLRDATQRIQSEFTSQPDLKAQALLTIGDAYNGLGNVVEAEKALRESLKLDRELYGEENDATATSMVLLGGQLLNQNNFADAEQLLQKGIAIERKLKTPETRSLYYGLFCLGELNVRRGDYATAKPLLEEALALSTKEHGEKNEDPAYVLVAMGRAKQFSGDLAGTEAAYRRSIAILRQLPQRFEIRMAVALSNLGGVLTEKASYDEAIAALAESDTIAQKAGDSIYLLIAKQYLCAAYLKKGDYAKAIEAGKQAVETGRKIKLETFSGFSAALNDLGLSLTRAGNAGEAEPYLREALEIRKRPAGSALQCSTEIALGECLTAQARYAEAEPLLMEGYSQLKSSSGENNKRTIRRASAIGKALRALE